MIWIRFLSILLAISQVYSIREDDLITNLPGLLFPINFKVYSGYLNASDDGRWQMFYMLTESKGNPSTDPTLVWFSGGPGCSSLTNLFEELGPFYMNQDGRTLYENIYSWNTRANVLFLESPIGVGFSYDTTVDGYYIANDDQTCHQNFRALYDFFSRVQPQYANRSFFLSGDSYAGVYLPMLASALTNAINNNTFPNPNFQGVAIGNGYLNVKHQQNSAVLWSAYHARVSMQDWDEIKVACKQGNETDVEDYDFTKFMVTRNRMNYQGDNSTCGRLIDTLINFPDSANPYNYYGDCYGPFGTDNSEERNDFTNAVTGDRNTANLINYVSTDNQWGYFCWVGGALWNYLNQKVVQDALHIPDAWRKQFNYTMEWGPCNGQLFEQYIMTYTDTYQFFNNVLQNINVPNFRFLVYNGDVDAVCNFLGDAWHIRDVGKMNNLQTTDREPWYFSKNNQIAGYVQTYSGWPGKQPVFIDVLTVKGAGHFVPNERSGPSVQMITNFMFPPQDQVLNYSATTYTNPMPPITPLFPSAYSTPGN